MVDTPCILWTGRINEHGYGTIGIHLAHRRAYQEQVGPIPEGLVLDHLCDVRACVAVDHLEPVTQTENVRRMLERGRHWGQTKTQCRYLHGEDQYVGSGPSKRYCLECKRISTSMSRARKRLAARGVV